MLTDLEITEIVRRMIKKLEETPDENWVSTSRLLLDLGYDLKKIDQDLNRIHSALFAAAEEEGILLDMSSHEDKFEGLVYNLDFQVFHQNQDDALNLGYQMISPIPIFSKYLELIFDNDDLWENFQNYVRQSGPYRGEEFFEYHRDQECIDIWRQMLDNMGGGFPITLFASAAFLLLAYKEQGHDLDAELEALHQRKAGENKK